MGKRRPVQLELPEPAMTAADRKRWIRERLHGYEYRQAVRDAKRKAAIEKRKLEEDGEHPDEKARKPTQTSIPSQFYRRVD